MKLLAFHPALFVYALDILECLRLKHHGPAPIILCDACLAGVHVPAILAGARSDECTMPRNFALDLRWLLRVVREGFARRVRNAL